MKAFSQILFILTLLCPCLCFSQDGHPVVIDVKISEKLKPSVKSTGRLFVRFESQLSNSPNTYRSGRTNDMGKNFDQFPIEEGLTLSSAEGWISNYGWTFENVPEGKYEVYVCWDQNLDQAGYRNPGNIINYPPVQVDVSGPTQVDVTMAYNVPISTQIVNHELVREVIMISDTLSKWWNKEMSIKASVLLPSNYNESDEYAIRYNIAGYGGRYSRINGLIKNSAFMDWWTSEKAPQIINVFLDGYGPYGDCYQMDSENSGPYGHALIHELIPHVESMYRGTDSPNTRFVDGCSTGGWVSLGLQLFYPEEFNGCFSYSPDPVDFERFQLINIYKDKNAFVNEYNYEQPMRRNVLGEPRWSMREFINQENTLSPVNSYIQSGGQFGAFNALYSPKAKNGLPAPLFDAKTGEIDSLIAIHWSKYDLLKFTKENWEKLGPKIQGKIFLSMGDMDDFYLNFAARSFDEFLKNTENPKSDAIIEFLPEVGHCDQFSHQKVLEQISERLNKINNGD